jgi:hypothetical protein
MIHMYKKFTAVGGRHGTSVDFEIEFGAVDVGDVGDAAVDDKV